jgi:MYXO-CTERM domain-containing protein
MARLASALAAALLSPALVPACTQVPTDADATDASNIGQVRQAIIGGTESDPSQDAVVMLVLVDPVANRRLEVCTATMIAPKLLVTARHCVAQTNENVACQADGTPLLGGEIGPRDNPANLYVFTGKDRPPFIGDISGPLDMTKWHPAGQGATIIDDLAATLCNHDIGLVILKDPIPNVPLASLRLDGDPAVGEPLLTVGWGVAEDQVEPSVRRQRSGDVSVERVGPDSAVPVLTKSEFQFGESICLGDSGGPIFSGNTNALIGVVSRGGNGASGAGGPASTCTDATNIGTKLSYFKQLITDAFNQAGASPILEPPPKSGKCNCAPASTTTSSFWPLAALALAGLRSVRRSRGRTRPPAPPNALR